MRNSIQEKIEINKEILSALPKNNEKNVSKYIEKSNSIYETYDEFKAKILAEIKNRFDSFNAFEKNPEINKLEDKLKDLETESVYFNSVNSPFEKTGLDKIIYSISKYYKGNLSKVNNDILKAINVFKDVGVTLDKDDFDYSECANSYMKVFFEEISDIESINLKRTFEKLYWKRPNIILDIELNFRKLYYKHEKQFESYIDKKQKAYTENGHANKQDYLSEYRQTVKEMDSLSNKSDYNVLEELKNKKFKLADYNKESILKIYSHFSYEKQPSYINTSVILKLNGTLKEYRNYLEFKFVINNIKEIVDKSEEKKENSKSKLKEIQKLESQLENSFTKSGFLAKFKKSESNYSKIIDELKIKYQELDDMIFREKVNDRIKADSKIYDVFKISSSYYIYMVKSLKKEIENITDEEINDKVEKLIKFLMNPYNNLVNNLNAFEEYDIPMIVSDKYKLDGLNVTMEMLKPDNLEKIINQTDQILKYHYLNNLENLNFEKLKEFTTLYETIEKNDLTKKDK